MAVPFTESHPFDGQRVSEATWRDMMSSVMPDGPLITDLPPSQWKRQLEVTRPGSAHAVRVQPGEVWIRGHHGSLANQVEMSINVNPTPSLPRLDLVVARADFVRNRIELDVVQGTPGDSAPEPTQSAAVWEIPLAEVRVTSTVEVTDRRRCVGYSTGEIEVWSLGTPIQSFAWGHGSGRYWRLHDRLHIEATVNPGADGFIWAPLPYPMADKRGDPGASFYGYPRTTETVVIGAWGYWSTPDLSTWPYRSGTLVGRGSHISFPGGTTDYRGRPGPAEGSVGAYHWIRDGDSGGPFAYYHLIDLADGEDYRKVAVSFSYICAP